MRKGGKVWGPSAWAREPGYPSECVRGRDLRGGACVGEGAGPRGCVLARVWAMEEGLPANEGK